MSETHRNSSLFSRTPHALASYHPNVAQPGRFVIETAEETFNPTQLQHKETVFTLSNGYLGTRGTFEEGFLGACPATLINGVYDRAPIVFTELANCPDWLPLTLSLGGDRFRLDRGEVLRYQRSLDLVSGVLRRDVRWRSPSGYTFELHFERFVSLADDHVLALRCQVTSVDFAGPVTVQAALNGYADNEGLLHWNWIDQGGDMAGAWLHMRSRHSQIDLGMAMRLRLQGAEAIAHRAGFQGCPTVEMSFDLQPDQTVAVDKCVTIYTSRDGVASPVTTAQEAIATLPSYGDLLVAHEAAWAAVWRTNDVVIEGDDAAQLAIRYNLFQLLSAAPRHNDRVSIPAKTLSGFAYRGHVFWDTEIFVLPMLTLTQPAIARNLLTYRYHTLAGARAKAKALGYEGAMYVWESADTGDEVTPTWVPHFNGKDLVRIWCGDLEVHISTDVAYAAWQYWQATGDRDWLLRCGAEMILDTAVFWGSRAQWNAAGDRYDVCDVIGPDEYHDRVDNNAFTNRMVQWHLQTALDLLDWLRTEDPERAAALTAQLDLSTARLAHWRAVIEKLWIAYDPETCLVEQFEGFFGLEDIDLASYEPRDRSMQVILGIEGASDRQVLKQADVLMMLYLLRQVAWQQSPEATTGLVGCDRATLQANWDYYVPRTDHTYGSSLGPPIHAVLACDLDQPEAAYEHFMRAALVDLADVRGNAHEGIHAASAGGVWQAVIFGFGGVQFTPHGPIAAPKLPAHWKRLAFQLQWQGQTYTFDLRAEPMRQIQPSLLPIQGVIFDLDGVLTDTSEFHYLGWKRLADEEGLAFDREANEALRGVSRRDSLRRLLGDRTVPETQFQAMMDRKNQYYLELIRTITPEHLLPGVKNLLEELRSAGLRVAIGSASKNAQEVVQRLGISHYIDAIADGHCVLHSKPAPDVFLYAANQLGLPSAACVVVEDAASGIEAALRADMWAVGLGPVDRVGAAHVVLPNLADIHWAELLRRLSWVAHPSAQGVTLQHLQQRSALAS